MESSDSEQEESDSAPAEEPSPIIKPFPIANPSLSASVRADYEALRNDVDQAKELAAELQRQLAGKSNEVAHFKQLLEKTQNDLNRLEASLQSLRRERHEFANEIMRLGALEAELKRVKAARDQLQTEAEKFRSAGANRVNDLLVINEEQQREITRLRAALEVLKQREGSGAPALSAPNPAADSQKEITDLNETVRRLQELLNKQARAGTTPKMSAPAKGSAKAKSKQPPSPPPPPIDPGDPNFIQISYDS
jgi:chromosome segregation ATPase